MPAGRTSFVAGYDQAGNRLVIFGGFGTGEDGFNGETWALGLGPSPAWSLLGDGLGRAECYFARDAVTNREFVLGGQTDGFAWQAISQLALATGTWNVFSPTGTPPTMGLHDIRAVAYDATRSRFVLLGSQSSGDSHSFDPATSVWTTKANTGTVPVVSSFAVYDPVRDRFLAQGSGGIYGIAAGTFTWSLLTAQAMAPTMIYDASRDRVEGITTTGVVWAMSMDTPPVWSQLSSSTPPIAPWKWDTPVIHDTQADRLVVHSGGVSNATWAFSLITNTWELVNPGASLEARQEPSSVVVPPWDAIVSFGGTPGTATVSRFPLDGTGFQTVTTAGLPPAGRYAHAAIYDPVRARMLVFGGRNGSTYLNDVHALSIGPTPTWTALSPAGPPPEQRAYCEAVYDPVRDRMLVFGGTNASVSSFRDLWALSLSGTPTWTKLFDNGVPPQMPELIPGAAAMVYDSRRDRVVVVATESGSLLKAWSCPLTGTAQWMPFAGSAFERMFFDAAFDSLNDRVLVFGGTNSAFTSANGELTSLSFPAGTWGAVSLANPPRARFEHTFVRDPAHGRFVLMHGDETNTGDPYNSWGAPVWFLNDAAAMVDVPPRPIAGGFEIASCRLVAPDRVAISADVAEAGDVALEVFDLVGRRWGRSRETVSAAGHRDFTVVLHRDVAPGLYFVRAVQGPRSARGKLVVVR
jgi:hypothetical protein